MSPLPILVVEHEAKCPPAHVGAWLEGAGAVLDVVRPWRGEELPTLDEYAALLVLGGTMGANDDDRAPWLPRVRGLIREAAAAELPTLGICLGHQLAAVALGGSVVTNPHGQQLGLVETGWLPAADSDPLVSGRPLRGVQWNNDIVATLPPGAALLASTAAGEPQVVRFAPSVWGLQLHPEADEVIVGEWARGDREIHATRGIDQAAFLAAIRTARAELDAAWRPVLERFAALAGCAGPDGPVEADGAASDDSADGAARAAIDYGAAGSASDDSADGATSAACADGARVPSRHRGAEAR